MEKCPKCKVALRRKRVDMQIMEPGKKLGTPFYVTVTFCPKCKRDERELIRIKAEMERKKALKPRKCPKCKTMMIRSQETHQLWRKKIYNRSLLEPEQDYAKGEFIANTSVYNPTWRCPNCDYKERTNWGHNFVTMSLSNPNGRGAKIYFPDDWVWNTEVREVWVDL